MLQFKSYLRYNICVSMRRRLESNQCNTQMQAERVSTSPLCLILINDVI